MKLSTVSAIKCEICGQLHDVTTETFVTFAGDVNIGLRGGVVGGNFEGGSKPEGPNALAHCTFVCRSQDCIERLLEPLNVFPKRR